MKKIRKIVLIRYIIKDKSMHVKSNRIIISAVIMLCGIAYTQETIDEAALFSDTSMIVSDTQLVDNASLISEKPPPRVP